MPVKRRSCGLAIRRWAAGVLVVGLAAGGRPVAADAPDPAAAELAAQAAILRSHDPAVGIRGVLRFALEAVGRGLQPEAVDEAIALARGMQVADPAAADHGNFRWRLGDEGVSDPNAVEFALQLSTLLSLDHAERLSPRGRELLAAIHRDAASALERHDVRPGYTNMFLMKAWNCLALAALGNDAFGPRGRAMWREWFQSLRTSGIGESVSPTYYGVDLDSLGLIASRAPDAGIRREAAAAIAYLWTSIAAHFFLPAERLAGPHARDYDRLRGVGYLDEHLAAAGWLTRPPLLEGAGWLPRAPRAHLDVFRRACAAAAPPAGLRDLATAAPRTVVERFGVRPWQRSVNWVGKSLAIGSAGECRGGEDKPLAIHLPGGPQVANVAVLFDGRGDPYGVLKDQPGDEGPRKARHLKPFVLASQRGPRVTTVWFFDPARPRFAAEAALATGLSAHLLLPVEAEVWVGDEPVEPPATLPADAVVFLRLADVAVAVRWLTAAGEDDDRLGPAPALAYVADGRERGAKRLTATFADARPTRPALLALDIEAREGCDDAAFGRFREEFRDRDVRLAVAAGRLAVAGSVPLEIDLDHLRPLAYEPALEDGRLLEVDGVDLGGRRLVSPPLPGVWPGGYCPTDGMPRDAAGAEPSLP